MLATRTLLTLLGIATAVLLVLAPSRWSSSSRGNRPESSCDNSLSSSARTTDDDCASITTDSLWRAVLPCESAWNAGEDCTFDFWADAEFVPSFEQLRRSREFQRKARRCGSDLGAKIRATLFDFQNSRLPPAEHFETAKFAFGKHLWNAVRVFRHNLLNLRPTRLAPNRDWAWSRNVSFCQPPTQIGADCYLLPAREAGLSRYRDPFDASDEQRERTDLEFWRETWHALVGLDFARVRTGLGHVFLRANLMAFLMRPHGAAAEFLSRAKQSLGWRAVLAEERSAERPVIGMHVRRGDSCLDRVRSGESRGCADFAAYAAAALRFQRHYGARVVFLATDSAEVINQTRDYATFRWLFLPLSAADRAAFAPVAATEPGARKPVRMIERLAASGEIDAGLVSLTTVADLSLLGDCDVFIGSAGASVFSQLAFALQFARQGFLPPFVNVDFSSCNYWDFWQTGQRTPPAVKPSARDPTRCGY